jgi:hypothetical protein
MSAVINFYHGDSDIIPMCNYFWLYQQQVLYSGTHKYQNLFTMLYKLQGIKYCVGGIFVLIKTVQYVTGLTYTSNMVLLQSILHWFSGQYYISRYKIYIQWKLSKPNPE